MRASLFVSAVLGLLGIGAAAAWMGSEEVVAASVPEAPREQASLVETEGSLPGAELLVGPVLRGAKWSSTRSRAHVPGSPAATSGATAWASNEDPWTLPTDHAAEPAPSAEAPRPVPYVREVRRTRISPDGSLESRSGPVPVRGESWSPPSEDDGRTLVGYDISRLLLAEDALGDPLLGRETLTLGPVQNTWWIRLLERLRDAVGAHGWPEATTLLAWDMTEGLLLVRQDDWGHARVAAVLNSVAQRQAGSIRLDIAPLERRRSTRGAALSLDVPWASVRAHQGRSATYVCDYEMLCGNDWNSIDPVLGALDLGLGVVARRVEGEGPEGSLELEIAWSGDVPRFEPLQTELYVGYPVVIETPDVRCARWGGTLLGRAGRHRITLDDGTAWLVTVGQEMTPSEVPEEIKGCVLHERGRSAAVQTGPSDTTVHVRWTDEQSGESLSGCLSLPPNGGHAHAGLEKNECAALKRWLRGMGLAEEAADGVRIDVITRPLSDGSLVLDYVLSLRRTTGTPRTVQALQRAYGHPDVRTFPLDLPESDVCVLSRRVVLPPSGSVSVPLEADLGSGRERFSLAFDRRPVPR